MSEFAIKTVVSAAEQAEEVSKLLSSNKENIENGIVDNNLVIEVNNTYNSIKYASNLINGEIHSIEEEIAKTKVGNLASDLATFLSNVSIASGVANHNPSQIASGYATLAVLGEYNPNARAEQRLDYAKNLSKIISDLESKFSNNLYALKKAQAQNQKAANFVYDNGKIYIKGEPTQTDILSYVKSQYNNIIAKAQRNCLLQKHYYLRKCS